MLAMSKASLENAFGSSMKDAPPSLTSEYKERRSKQEAITQQIQRKSATTPLFPSGNYKCHRHRNVLKKGHFFVLKGVQNGALHYKKGAFSQ